MRSELEATFKEDISIYFDENPHDGLLQHHEVDDSLKEKLRCLILIPIVSQTYCDPKAFAWQHELLAFIKLATEDKLGLKTKVGGGNTASRVLPVRIHEVDARDKKLFEEATGGVMRPIDFIYKESGVNRPLRPSDDRGQNQERTDYRNQVNKVANAIKDIIAGLQGSGENTFPEKSSEVKRDPNPVSRTQEAKRNWKVRPPKFTALFGVSLALAAALLAFLALAIFHISEPLPENSTYKSSILPVDKTTFSTRFGGNFAVSPDGKLLAFVAEDSANMRRLWVRPLHALSGSALSGTEGAMNPFWSPDSRSIGYFADGKLKRIEASGGPAQNLCHVGSGSRGGSGSWSTNGTILFCIHNKGASLSRIPATGGSPMPITKLKADSSSLEMSHRWPWFLPDGEHFLYLARTSSGNVGEQDAIYMASLDTTSLPRPIVRSGTNAAYANGHLLFSREQTLMAQPFDVDQLETTGDAVPIAERLDLATGSGNLSFSVSQNGVLVYQAGVVSSGTKIAWYDRNGKQAGVIDHSAYITEARLSTDGNRIATSDIEPKSGNQHIWLYEIGRSIWTRITFDPHNYRWPIWSPDGRTIVYQEGSSLLQKASSGEGSEELLLKSVNVVYPEDWSANGKFIAYTANSPNTYDDIWILPMNTAGERKPILFLLTKFNESYAAFSPDGRWIAYQSDVTGVMEIYIRPFPGPGGTRQVSTTGGGIPRWRHDGKELFFSSGSKIMAAEIELKQTTVEVGGVRPLIQIMGVSEGYDVTGDGKKFLVLTRGENPGSSALTLVVNWPGEIGKK